MLNLQPLYAPDSVFTSFDKKNPWFIEDDMFFSFIGQKFNRLYKCNLSLEARLKILSLIKVLYP